MRRTLGGAWLAIPLLAGSLGCDTNQPVQGSTKNAEVQFETSVGLVAVYDVWDATKVTTTFYPDRDPVALYQALGLWCDVPATIAEQTRGPVSYPLRYQVTVEKIPAGSSTPILLTDPLYMDASSLASVTRYDETPLQPLGNHAGSVVSDTTVSGIRTLTTVELTNGRRVSTASREFLVYPKISMTDALNYGSKCPFAGFGNATSATAFADPAVAGSSPTFGVELATGDTVVVRAAKDQFPLSWVLYASATGPNFRSSLFVDGTDVTTTVLGRTMSAVETDEGIAYSYTQR